MQTRILGILLLLACSAQANSQVFRRFSTEIEKYPEELQTYFGNALSDEELLDVQAYIQKWTSGEISDTNKSFIIAVSNELLSKLARPKPHYLLFLRTLEQYEARFSGEQSLDDWKRAFLDMASDGNTLLSQIYKFLRFSYQVVDQGIINKTSATTWKFKGSDFEFSYTDSLRLAFRDITLSCKVLKDSCNIHHTNGVYNPVARTWKGKGGVVTWERSQYDTTKVFAELPDYSIDLTLSGYHADSVSFTNLNYMDYKLHGTLDDRPEAVRSPEQMNHPRFNSYQSNYTIDDLYANINYRGGLSMYGSTLVGSGTRLNPARLAFFRNDSLKLIARSVHFAMEPERITSQDVAVAIPIGYDSIIHPNIGMTYFVDKNQLSLYRTQSFQSRAPYYNNYHKVEMSFEQLRWNLDENRILLTMNEASASGLASFKSDNLFDAQQYMSLQGIDRVNPLVALRSYGEQVMGITFLGADYAKHIGVQHYQLQQLLKRLAIEGFIFYNLDNDLITLRQKLFDWVYAGVNAIDYDVINLVSETQSPHPNAGLDLSTYDLTINGIRNIRLSNAQNVTIFPHDDQIIMKQNRSFQFDGVVVAGLFTLFGKNFFFDYDSFKLDLQDIDSLHLRVKTGQLDASGRSVLLNIQSMIQDMTGELQIDDPGNKSGRKNFPNYPVFTSGENSYVYYDDPSIQQGVYNRDKFYFEIFPFSFDSLDNFNARGLRLDGRFISADIFPPIEQTLIVQEDNSLGFRYNTGTNGLPLYGGKGQYHDFLQLSNKGLRGRGDFEYLSSRAWSDDIIFHPDSMFCTADRFEIGKQTAGLQFPPVRSKENDLVWYPYDDRLDVAEGSEPFTILNDSTVLEGMLALGPGGLTGSGKMELTNSVLLSDSFTYTAEAFAADTADLRLKSVNTSGYTLVTDNVNAKVDFSKRSGLFRTNEEYSLVEFPENKYVSQLDLFQWNMDDNVLVMGSAATAGEAYRAATDEDLDKELVGPRYISTDPVQDSLDFFSTSAVYDYRRNIIRASNVKFLKVADAWIFPAGGKIVIEPDGSMGQLDSARILANRTTRLHEVYDASVQVKSSLDYTGSGRYDYVDEKGEVQVIDLDRIGVDDSVHTLASGTIPRDAGFMLSPYYGFTGQANLFAGRKFLVFNGEASLVHSCEQLDSSRVRFEAEIDPEDIYIPVAAKSFDFDMRPVYQGLFITRDSTHIYPAFFSRRKLSSDQYILSADGFLYYDREEGKYLVASSEKLDDRSKPGNFLSLEDSGCEEYGEGRLRLGIILGQIRTSTVGNIRHDMNSNESELNLMYGMNFFMSEEALAIMAAELDSMQGLEAADLSDEFYNKGIAEYLGAEKAGQMQAELGLYGEYRELPPDLAFSLFFSRVHMHWNQTTRSYRSEGKIGIGNINGNQVHKMVDGYMELSKRRSGDLFDVYLQPDEHTWYYFGYTRGVLHVLSSNREFNATIGDLSTRQRRMKTPKNQIPYIFIVATSEKKNMFLRSFLREEEEESQ